MSQPAPDPALIDDCLSWIRTTDYVSFAELERWLEGRGIHTEGTYSLEPAPNVLVWAGVNEQFCDIFEKLRPHLDIEPCSSVFVYLADGKALNLPIAKRPPRGGYKEPHWAPVTLRAKRKATRDELRQAFVDAVR